MPAQIREHLVIAFLIDTVQAALACPLVRAVTVVTDDLAAAHAARRAGADIFSPQLPRPGLNRDLTAFARTTPGDQSLAVLLADLPALTPSELTVALTESACHTTAFARDQQGSGTTLLYSRRADALRPAFGNRSAHRHHTAGAHPLTHVGTRPAPGRGHPAQTSTRPCRSGVGAHTSAEIAAHQDLLLPHLHHPDNSTTRGAQHHAQPENRLQSLRRTIRPQRSGQPRGPRRRPRPGQCVGQRPLPTLARPGRSRPGVPGVPRRRRRPHPERRTRHQRPDPHPAVQPGRHRPNLRHPGLPDPGTDHPRRRHRGGHERARRLRAGLPRIQGTVRTAPRSDPTHPGPLVRGPHLLRRHLLPHRRRQALRHSRAAGTDLHRRRRTANGQIRRSCRRRHHLHLRQRHGPVHRPAAPSGRRRPGGGIQTRRPTSAG